MPPRFVRTIATRSGIAHGAPIEFARCDVFPSSRLTFSPHGRSRVTALRSLPTRADSAIPKCRCSHARCTCLRYPSTSRGPCFNPQPIRRSAATGDDDAQRQLGRVSILSRSGDRLQRRQQSLQTLDLYCFNPQPIRRSAATMLTLGCLAGGIEFQSSADPEIGCKFVSRSALRISAIWRMENDHRVRP